MHAYIHTYIHNIYIYTHICISMYNTSMLHYIYTHIHTCILT